MEWKKQWDAEDNKSYPSIYMYLIGLMSQLKIVLIMTNCTRFFKCSTWYETALLCLRAWTQSNHWWRHDCLKARPIYGQYSPAKPIMRGIRMWMQCDADKAYLPQFQMYLGWQQNSWCGLEYDVSDEAMKGYMRKKSSCLFWQPVYKCLVIEGLAGL